MQNKTIPYTLIGILVIAGLAGASWYFVKRQSTPAPAEQPVPAVKPPEAKPPEETPPVVTPPEGQEKVPPEKAPADETANWKTYRNEKYGFEFRYPKEFAEDDKCAAREVDENEISVGYSIDIAIENSRGLSLSEYVDQDFNQEEFEDVQRIESTIDRQEAISISYRTIGMGRLGALTYVLKDGKVYIFSFLAGVECPVAYEMGVSEFLVYNQILSTFRFLE